MSTFSESCAEFFDSASVERIETTSGAYWNLKPGWSSFELLYPIRSFLQLDFIFSSECAQKITLTLRDKDNENFFIKSQVISAGPVARVRAPCPNSWLKIVEVFSPTHSKLLGIEGIDFKKDFESYKMNSRSDLQISAKDVVPKFRIGGVEFKSEFDEPWEALIKANHAFSSETIYVEHLSASASTQIFDGQTQEIYIKGPVSLCKSGKRAGLSETVIRAQNGGTVNYETEALIRGSPTIKIKRISESGVNRVPYTI